MNGWLDERSAANAVPVWPREDAAADLDRLKAQAVALAREARAEAVAAGLKSMVSWLERTSRGVWRTVCWIADAAARYQKQRQTLAALGALDDRTLKDLGLSRGNLLYTASSGANPSSSPSRAAGPRSGMPQHMVRCRAAAP
jgi:uncharacterized protein YjiS (DUF1127 family)